MKRKRRINKRKLRQLRARDALLERLAAELQRAKVVDSTIAEAMKAFAVIIRNGANK